MIVHHLLMDPWWARSTLPGSWCGWTLQEFRTNGSNCYNNNKKVVDQVGVPVLCHLIASSTFRTMGAWPCLVLPCLLQTLCFASSKLTRLCEGNATRETSAGSKSNKRIYLQVTAASNRLISTGKWRRQRQIMLSKCLIGKKNRFTSSNDRDPRPRLSKFR
jgi:hypothetical protein